ncbi:uncharacterized protein LOC100889384 [Strongylocentrotus purpuratus]|uniref:Uncharacterized protein n=1 Tax=Strongylocentrotus purpuratus TaxID=7668 RepID=A0A7M7PLW1_STRPU|nr:uncharacterized protein LOC100889384 [Strongylocentrotus purpuratus]
MEIMDEARLASLEDLCLDQVVHFIPILGNELQGLSHALFKCLLPLCDDYRLALLHNIAVSKGLDIQTMWRDRCRARFLWFYRHKFKSNLHDSFWQCHACLSTTLNDPHSQDVDWYQTYMDKICEENLEKIRTETIEQGREIPRTSVDEETKAILKYPFWRDSEDIIQYKPHQLLLNIKTVIALTRSPSALSLLAHHLHTLMCRVQIPTKYRELATSALERFLRALLARGNLETMYLKEQQIMRGESVDYACLLAMLLLGIANDERKNNENAEQTVGMLEEENSLESQETALTNSPQRTDDFSEDLYDFCFKEPVKTDFYSAMVDTDADPDADSAQACIPVAGNVYDMFCEEGAAGEESMNCVMTSNAMPEDLWRDECCHYVDPEITYFQHILNVPGPGPSLGHSISNLALVYVRLNAESCTALADCVVRSTSLQSLALIQCVMPACGWCEVMSGLALRAQKGLVLQELALTFSQTYRTTPKSMFGQYCAHKLNEMLEAYHIRNHKMKSLKLELLLSHKCQAAENSYLPKYLPSTSCLTLNCWGRPLTLDHSNSHPLHQLVSPADLASAIQSRDSALTDLLLENSSLDTVEVDTLLAAAANSPMLKRLSVRRNRYSTSQPKGLLALLQHSGIRSLDLCQCKFSIKEGDTEFQDGLVDALINNCSLQHLNLSDRVLDDEDLAILSRAFAVSKRPKQQPGYCLNICLSPFSSRALMQFGEMLSKDVDGCRSNKRVHSLDHLSLDWRCVNMIRTLKTIIPRVTCPHRLS